MFKYIEEDISNCKKSKGVYACKLAICQKKASVKKKKNKNICQN